MRDDIVKESCAYKAIEECLHFISGHDEFNDLHIELELAQFVMLYKKSTWHKEHMEDLQEQEDTDDSIPPRE